MFSQMGRKQKGWEKWTPGLYANSGRRNRKLESGTRLSEKYWRIERNETAGIAFHFISWMCFHVLKRWKGELLMEIVWSEERGIAFSRRSHFPMVYHLNFSVHYWWEILQSRRDQTLFWEFTSSRPEMILFWLEMQFKRDKRQNTGIGLQSILGIFFPIHELSPKNGLLAESGVLHFLRHIPENSVTWIYPRNLNVSWHEIPRKCWTEQPSKKYGSGFQSSPTMAEIRVPDTLYLTFCFVRFYRGIISSMFIMPFISILLGAWRHSSSLRLKDTYVVF
jgi:hypothetical protein